MQANEKSSNVSTLRGLLTVVALFVFNDVTSVVIAIAAGAGVSVVVTAVVVGVVIGVTAFVIVGFVFGIPAITGHNTYFQVMFSQYNKQRCDFMRRTLTCFDTVRHDVKECNGHMDSCFECIHCMGGIRNHIWVDKGQIGLYIDRTWPVDTNHAS